MSVDLTTCYMGLELSNPLVVAACPLTGDLNTVQQLAESGAAAIVLPSLFEEQFARNEGEKEQTEFEFAGQPSPQEPLNVIYRPAMSEYRITPDEYLRHIESTKKSVSIPVIGSLNGSSHGGWIRFAKLIEEAGANALELNIYFIAADARTTPQQVEERYVEIVSNVRRSISIPLAVKIGPFFAALPHFAAQLVAAGADSLVLFNRFLEPEFDVDTLQVQPHLDLSNPAELRLPLRWIAILRGELDVSLAATSGVHDSTDAVKALLAGADVAMMASALMRKGPTHVRETLTGLENWLKAKNFESVEQLKGLMSRREYRDRSAFERANYMRALSSFDETFD